jgi:hypothetical protein
VIFIDNARVNASSIHQKECRKSLGCALYIRCALSIEKYGIYISYNLTLKFFSGKEGATFQLQAWAGAESSRRLRLQYLKTVMLSDLRNGRI